MESRKSASACRVISLAPPGHSPNEVLDLIHDDLVTGAKEGFYEELVPNISAKRA